ncbi:galactokinase [Vagococcus penaei]|uniref:Galactokinase n=1 Tax=Vagococcus penaei TaxID=633807 RepID=A0A1Q2D8T5_9ENTE|nr:galactokinase [Vagococcus penaei]RSU00012.1 galactokinase [Vagococcus penaei]
METLNETFIKIFNEKPESAYFAPGRINLIGEHTDYNGGNVFPCAISYGTYGVVKAREDRLVRLYSMNFPDLGIKEFSLDDLTYKEADNWANYPKGMIGYLYDLVDNKEAVTGFDVVIFGDIPNGAGLSSSASIELLTGVIVEDLWQLTLDRVELVKLGQKVENHFIGVNSGIMDQFAIGMGQKDQAILLDCHTLNYEMVPVHLENEKILIMNTNKRRELADSKYNERRAECDEALRRLQTVTDIQALGELSLAQFDELKAVIKDDTLEKRARHAVAENQRTLEAKQALEANDLQTFGELLNASHQSLRDDYEVTGQELDTIVALTQAQNGVIGARMTGAGFGGCAIALVKEDKLPEIIQAVGKAYQEKIGYEADFYVASIADGAKKID